MATTSAPFSGEVPAPSPYVVTADLSVAALNADVAFQGLEEQEAKYALALYKAVWYVIGFEAVSHNVTFFSVVALACIAIVAFRTHLECIA